jgi:hypothetical protein
MSDISAMANAERAQLDEELQGLTNEQWATMTVCEPWTVRHVAAHLTALGNQTAPNFFKGLITSGFSFSKFVANDLVKYNQGSNTDVLAGYAQTLVDPRVHRGASGPGVELIRAMTGRGDALDQCRGDGIDTMRARCS